MTRKSNTTIYLAHMTVTQACCSCYKPAQQNVSLFYLRAQESCRGKIKSATVSQSLRLTLHTRATQCVAPDDPKRSSLHLADLTALGSSSLFDPSSHQSSFILTSFDKRQIGLLLSARSVLFGAPRHPIIIRPNFAGLSQGAKVIPTKFDPQMLFLPLPFCVVFAGLLQGAKRISANFDPQMLFLPSAVLCGICRTFAGRQEDLGKF